MDQANRTAKSSRIGVFAVGPVAVPSFGNYVTQGGDTVPQIRDMYRRCGDFTATVGDQGVITMTHRHVAAPVGIRADDVYVVATTVTTKPTAAVGNQPAQQHQISGHAAIGNRVVILTAEIYGFGSSIDMGQFNRLFAEAVDRARTKSPS